MDKQQYTSVPQAVSYQLSSHVLCLKDNIGQKSAGESHTWLLFVTENVWPTEQKEYSDTSLKDNSDISMLLLKLWLVSGAWLIGKHSYDKLPW